MSGIRKLEKQIDKITTIIDKEPIKIQLFIYQYFNFSKELIFLNEELQKDSNKKVYEEKRGVLRPGNALRERFVSSL